MECGKSSAISLSWSAISCGPWSPVTMFWSWNLHFSFNRATLLFEIKLNVLTLSVPGRINLKCVTLVYKVPSPFLPYLVCLYFNFSVSDVGAHYTVVILLFIAFCCRNSKIKGCTGFLRFRISNRNQLKYLLFNDRKLVVLRHILDFANFFHLTIILK